MRALALRPAWRADADEPPPLGALIRGQRRLGLAVMAVFAGGFLVWGSVAPLTGGAVAPGRVSPDGGVRVIQHLEGGILRALHVREGDAVEEGQPLLTLDTVGARAEVEALADRRRARLAEAARVEAELMGRAAVAFPAELDPAEPALAAERRRFETGRAMVEARRRVLGQRVEQLRAQIAGFEAQVASAAAQRALIEEEMADKGRLLDRGLMPKDEILRLRRAAAEIEGRLGEHRAAIARAEQAIGEAELELVALDAERAERLAARAGELRGEIAEIDQALAAAGDVLARAVVAAPGEGVVARLRLRTPGGVVRPGEAILDLVPARDRLLVDARVSPLDIDVVRPGLEAQVHLSAYPGRDARRIRGVVAEVSADAMTDEITGQPFFAARVEVPREALGEGEAALALVPGMPAEVLIVTERRTLMGYLLEPLADAVRRGLREA